LGNVPASHESTDTHELSDSEWELLRPVLPADPAKGGRWADHRRVINAILYRAGTGIPWRRLPPRYGPWETAAGRHRRWSLDGTWQRLADRLRGAPWVDRGLLSSIDSLASRASPAGGPSPSSSPG
jgi:transposase